MPSADNEISQADETAIARSIEAPSLRTVVATPLPASLQPQTNPASSTTPPTDSAQTMVAAQLPPTPTNPPSAASAAPEDGILVPGSIFHGDFKISESIAKRGGMGEVYRATNTINNTIVAIKMIRADLSHDPELVNKFIQEDEALRQLNNPAVVRYYGVRRDPVSGRYYIQMEYVDGPTLGEYVHERGAVPAPEARALCRHLALGLEDAHRSGIVHRDLSPDNVLLGNSELKNAKIIDFGIAKVASTGDFTTFRTSFVGKYRYASPEHFSASAPIDQRSDIYSLGLVIAAAAAGKPLEMGRDELSGATARLTVPDLSAVPVALRPMLTRMLDPDATHRPTAAELVVQLADRKERSDGGGGGQVLLWLGLVAAVMAGGAGGAYYLKQHPDIIASLTGKGGGGNGFATFGPNGGNGTGSGGTGNTGLGNTGNTAGNTTTGTGTAGTGTTGLGTSGSSSTGTGTTGNTGTGGTVFQPTGTNTTGTSTSGTGSTGTGTQVAKLPTGQPLALPDPVKQAINATTGVCGTLSSASFEQGRLLVAGLIKNQDSIKQLSTTVAGLGYTLDNQAVASPLGCQTLELLSQLGKVNVPTGANHPILSSRTPPVFRGEPAEVSGAFFLNAKRHLYWIIIDGSAGTAVVEHEETGTTGSRTVTNPNKAAGWDLVLLLVSPRELPALSALNQTTPDQVNIALENEVAKSANHRDVQSAYQFVRRAG